MEKSRSWWQVGGILGLEVVLKGYIHILEYGPMSVWIRGKLSFWFWGPTARGRGSWALLKLNQILDISRQAWPFCSLEASGLSQCLILCLCHLFLTCVWASPCIKCGVKHIVHVFEQKKARERKGIQECKRNQQGKKHVWGHNIIYL